MTSSNSDSSANLEPHYRMVPRDRLQEMPRGPVHVVLDNIRSAFNVGSIFRTADAGVAAHIHLCGMTAHPPNAKLAKTALGAFDYVPWSYHAQTADALEALRTHNIPCVAVEVGDGAVSYLEFDWPRPVAIVFGNEVHGVAAEVLARSDTRVYIPMKGHKNTLNVATAFGIVFYEVLRRLAVL